MSTQRCQEFFFFFASVLASLLRYHVALHRNISIPEYGLGHLLLQLTSNAGIAAVRYLLPRRGGWYLIAAAQQSLTTSPGRTILAFRVV